MKRPALVFAAAVALPTLVLGALALRSALDQRDLVQTRTAALLQKHTDLLAERVRAAVDDDRQAFVRSLDRLIASENAASLAAGFATRLPSILPSARGGFAATLAGRVLSPSAEQALAHPQLAEFLADNRDIVFNSRPVEFFQSSKQAAQAQGQADLQPRLSNQVVAQQRAVAPQQQVRATLDLSTWRGNFAALTAASPSGTIAIFVRDGLELLHWSRPGAAPDIVFGAVSRPATLRALWDPLVAATDLAPPDACLALLDERGKPVSQSACLTAPDWRHPFVATPIGETLPHWEAALYLSSPLAIATAGDTLTTKLLALVGLALVAIAGGTWALFADTRARLKLAEQKSDFVANVSHELKTPLTSIRMFAELLASGRVSEPAKRTEYLGIIALEAERLTRLVNNVLDFAGLERGTRRVEKKRVAVRALAASVWQAHEPRLRQAGFATRFEAGDSELYAAGDADALARILDNLIANAEKYSTETKEVSLRVGTGPGSVEVAVADRGRGVPAEAAARLFEPFFRADDSLASGIPGAGLGLALSRRLAREMSGDLVYRRREGSGSEFALTLPAAEASR